jgi:predicted ester cyclase
MQGTHRGPFVGPNGRELPATGNEVRFTMCGVLRVEGEKVVEVRDYLDRMGLLAQLGAVPLPAD